MAEKNDATRTALAVFGVIALTVATVAMRGWVLGKLWGWYVTPLVFLPPPSWAALMGLTGMAGYALNVPGGAGKEPVAAIGGALLQAGVVLAGGWLLHFFV